MIINYKEMEQQRITGFKGGNGDVLTQNFGYHKHEGNSEIVYIISGTGHFDYDGVREDVQAGSVHYCPMNHSHAMYNDGDDELVYFAIVPEHMAQR